MSTDRIGTIQVVVDAGVYVAGAGRRWAVEVSETRGQYRTIATYRTRREARASAEALCRVTCPVKSADVGATLREMAGRA